jgi:hypothetical protein
MAELDARGEINASEELMALVGLINALLGMLHSQDPQAQQGAMHALGYVKAGYDNPFARAEEVRYAHEQDLAAMRRLDDLYNQDTDGITGLGKKRKKTTWDVTPPAVLAHAA